MSKAKYKFGDIISYGRDLQGMVINPVVKMDIIGGTIYQWQNYDVLIFRANALRKGSIHQTHWTTDEDKSWRA